MRRGEKRTEYSADTKVREEEIAIEKRLKDMGYESIQSLKLLGVDLEHAEVVHALVR